MKLDSARPKPAVFWFTGLSGAGKTTLALKLFQSLLSKGYPVELLDGDVIRNKKPAIGFSKSARLEHLENAAKIAAELENQGITVIASFITPYEEARNDIRKRIRNYIEIHVETPLSVCESRDPKGLYKRARTGEIQNFTGISDPFDRPEHSEIRLDTSNEDIDTSFAKLVAEIKKIRPEIPL